MYPVPYAGGKRRISDSAIVVNNNSPIIFNIPYGPDCMYEIKVAGGSRRFSFIADADTVYLAINNANGKYNVTGSPATTSLRNFLNNQQLCYDSLALVANPQPGDAGTLQERRNDILYRVYQNAFNYADTVNNAAAFIKAFNTIEFGSNYDSAATLLERAVKRFGKIQKLKEMLNDAREMISIYANEYNIGDTLPVITLPDISGREFSTASLENRFYLIDFWATWYPKTLLFNNIKRKIFHDYGKRLALVSVAFDDDINAWRNMVNTQHLDWIQLIDEKMWRGTAARTLKFDSIPFNFLVNNRGIVIAKAIKPDSVIAVLNKLLH